MKIKFHIPTAEYAFIETEIEAENEHEAICAYNDLEEAVKGRNGASECLSDKDFNSALDEYLTTNTLKDGVEIYQKMSKAQQNVFQQIKKSLKRIEAKNRPTGL